MYLQDERKKNLNPLTENFPILKKDFPEEKVKKHELIH
jgi:hypothetical protein